MKKVLIGLFIIGAVALGCENKEVAFNKYHRASDKLMTLIQMDLENYKNGEKLGKHEHQVDKAIDEYANTSEHIIIEHEHELTKQEKNSFAEATFSMIGLVKIYKKRIGEQ